MSRPEEVEQWSDQDVYYWVFDVNIGQQHAVALWNAEVTGQILLTLKKSQLYEHCKALSKDTTSNLWREVLKLQKNNRKSIFKHKSKPSPVTPDYPDASNSRRTGRTRYREDDFDSDFSDEGDDGDVADPNAESLHDRLKASLREFQEQRTQEQDNHDDMQDDYIDPDDHNAPEEPQDDYEEFDRDDGQADQDELYLPPDGTNQGPDLPPPLPSRLPIGGDTNSNAAPVLPPRPGQPIPKYKLHQQSIPQFLPPPPMQAEDSEEEYVIPSSQVDPRQPQPMHLPEDSDEFYEPPNDPSDGGGADFGDEYIVPDHVPMPKPPSGRRSPVNPSIPRPQKPKPAIPSNPKSAGKDMGRRAPAPLPHDNNNSTGTKQSTGHPTESSTVNSMAKRLAGIMGNNTNSGSSLTASQSFTHRKDMFSKAPAVTPKPLIPISGGSLHQIKKNLDKSPSHKRRATTIPLYNPPDPAPPEPVQPAMPRPRPLQNTARRALSDCQWFREDVDRETVTQALLNYQMDGAFLVRPSGRKPDFPYTLQLLYRGKVKNLPIGKRMDKKFALGAPKDGETRFDSVPELIDYHTRQEVVLAKDEGKTCLREPVPLP